MGSHREVAFTSITWFTSLDAVRGFAGDDYERAVVEEGARAVLSRWDERAVHHDVAFDVRLPSAGGGAGQPLPAGADLGPAELRARNERLAGIEERARLLYREQDRVALTRDAIYLDCTGQYEG